MAIGLIRIGVISFLFATAVLSLASSTPAAFGSPFPPDVLARRCFCQHPFLGELWPLQWSWSTNSVLHRVFLERVAPKVKL
jgi:hypothetical protein